MNHVDSHDPRCLCGCNGCRENHYNLPLEDRYHSEMERITSMVDPIACLVYTMGHLIGERLMQYEPRKEIKFLDSDKVLMPKKEDIPKEFYKDKNEWNALVSRWFFSGLGKGEMLKEKKGINRNLALRHLSVLLQSFEPSHEDKIASVAFLMSLWFESLS